MKIPSSIYKGLIILLSTFVTHLSSTLYAQDVRILPAVTRTYAVTGVTVYQGPGRKIDNGTVLIKDGLIAAIGKDIRIPPEAVIVKGDSLYVYPGFIDGLSHIAVSKPKEEKPKERQKDPGNPPAEAAGITPNQDVRALLNPLDNSIDEWKAIGFTTTQTVPYGGMLPGSGAISFLAGSTVNNMVMVPNSSFYAELQPAERMYPNTIIGLMAKWRELYRQASLAKNYSNVYASNRSGLEAPGSDRILESFYPVIDKQIPVLFRAEKNLDIQRVLTLKSDLGFNLMLANVKEGWDLIPQIKAAGSRIFLSLELPEEKSEKDKKDKEKKKDDQAIVPDSVELKRLEKRLEDSKALYVAQASAFSKASVSFGFSTLTVKPKDVQGNLRRMIKAGLTEDAALAALTINAAQALGVSDRLGSLDPGKIANLVISHKPYFEEKSKVKFVFIDGALYKIDTPKPEKQGEKKP